MRCRRICVGRWLLPISLALMFSTLEPAWCASLPEVHAGSGTEAPAATTPGDPAGGRAPVAELLKDPGRLLTWLRDHSRDVAAASSRVDEARAGYRASRLFPNPVLGFNLSDINAGKSNPPGLGFHDTSITSYTLSETAEIGKRGPRIASANDMLGATVETYLDLLGQKAADARLALGRALYLRERQTTLEETLASARRVLDLEKARLDHGEVSGNDYDRLLLDTTTLESDFARSAAEYRASLDACRAVLFAECAVDDAGMEIAELGSAVALPEPPVDEESALAQRPDVKSLESEREAARMDLVLARRRRIPDPAIGIGYTHDNLTISGDQPNTFAVGVTVALPLFDRGQHDAARAAAHAAEIEAIRDTTLTSARADLSGLLRRKSFLESTVSTLQTDALPRSSGILDTTLQAFDQGEVGMTDLLLVRRNHTTLILNLMDLRFEYFTVRNELRRVLGLDAGVARKSDVARSAATDTRENQRGG
ncbi:MAG: TolC family protein [Acidobacteria bacterium]|nr:TolC family protein [Acidobacteriota bacterium]